MSPRHHHICRHCGAVWSCSDDNCWPWDDECRDCQDQQREEYFHAQAMNAAKDDDDAARLPLEF